MSDTNKEQSGAADSLAKTWGWIVGKRPESHVLIPVYARDAYQQQQRPPISSLLWWEVFGTWLRYYSIQLRWDIERRLARLLGRRWIG